MMTKESAQEHLGMSLFRATNWGVHTRIAGHGRSLFNPLTKCVMIAMPTLVFLGCTVRGDLLKVWRSGSRMRSRWLQARHVQPRGTYPGLPALFSRGDDDVMANLASLRAGLGSD